MQEGKMIGFISYHCEDKTCEIVALVSLAKDKGVGTALVTALRARAKECRCLRLRVFTTNDNMEALKLYQKRGFKITNIHRNAMTKVRQYKPQLPTVGANGIPLRDMIELETAL
jgi:GNAT superfamily N-acetyltransferase